MHKKEIAITNMGKVIISLFNWRMTTSGTHHPEGLKVQKRCPLHDVIGVPEIRSVTLYGRRVME